MRSRISIRGFVRPSVRRSVRPSVRRSVTHELEPCKSAIFDQNYCQYERERILCRVSSLVFHSFKIYNMANLPGKIKVDRHAGWSPCRLIAMQGWSITLSRIWFSNFRTFQTTLTDLILPILIIFCSQKWLLSRLKRHSKYLSLKYTIAGDS